MEAVLGVDVGTSSTKGCLVSLDGSVIATTQRTHDVSRPYPGHVEMDPSVWWREFVSIAQELTPGYEVAAVGVSGMGPCVVITDDRGNVLRPAILYGVDTRAAQEIEELESWLGAERIRERCGLGLTHQSPAPKLAWVALHEPDVFARARRWFMPASWLSWNLTGEYTLDHHSASQSPPLYDVAKEQWTLPWARPIVGNMDLPALVWADEIVGRIHAKAAQETGLPPGIPVVSGTIDAWSEAISADAHRQGDLMLMYGTTMFLINTLSQKMQAPGSLWATAGALRGTASIAGGMASGGAVTDWLRRLFSESSFSQLVVEADAVPPGARGLVMLPYFAGERTPLNDPDARGVVAGLTLQHTRGDLFRAGMEAVGFGVRHNVEAMRSADAQISRVIAVGGGATNTVWPQIVSDITGMTQIIPKHTIGASLGAAFLAARSRTAVSIAEWNPPRATVEPREQNRVRYDALYGLYRKLHASTSSIQHELARFEAERASVVRG